MPANHPKSMSRFDVSIQGLRGSVPTGRAEFLRYGGNTACLDIMVGNRRLIFDAGSGIVPLGKELVEQGVTSMDVFLSHAHYDHVIGLPFFAPLMTSGADLTLWYAGCDGAHDGPTLLDELLRRPFLPFSASDIRCTLHHEALAHQGQFFLDREIAISTLPLNHPGGCTALRIDAFGCSMVYAPDFEHDDGPHDAALVTFMQGATLAFLDATYLPEIYPAQRGFGHSHWQRADALARQAGVTRWVPFHHSFTRTDTEMEVLAHELRDAAPAADLLREGDALDLLLLERSKGHRLAH